VTQEEHVLTPDRVDRLAELIETHIDLNALLQHSVASHSFPLPELPQQAAGAAVRFGVAKDEAFCFYYPDNLVLLEQAGAELVFFSPLRDAHLPANLRGIYLGGGYPEVYVERLATNTSMRQELRCFIEQGGVVYAECGGLMYLTQAIRTVEGRDFPMVGIFPATAQMLPRL
jgi:cobyrinic acid a,c-diamide synthase